MNLAMTLFSLVLIGIISAFIAKRQGRRPALWFFIGFCFGFIGVLVLVLLPFITQMAINKKKNSTEALTTSQPTSFVDYTIASLDPYRSYRDANWYFLDDTHTSIGPVSFSELVNRWVQKELLLTSFVWQPSMSDWTRVQEVTYLKEALDRLS